MTGDFCKESIDYMEKTDIKYRKSLGQYFTPKKIRQELIKLLPTDVKNPSVIDPSCGTGEFLLTAKDYFNNPKLEGWEIDKKLVEISKKLVPDAVIKNCDSLNQKINSKFDFVIGNPPYFETKLNSKLKKKYQKIIGGRINIFSLFVYLGLNLLKENGYLAYVIPPSMNNGAYFSKLRKYIIQNSDIKAIKILSSNLFHRAQQLTMIMVLKKTQNHGKYIFKLNGVQIFSQNWEYLKKSFINQKSLQDLGFSVKTGSIVWNQNKNKLTNDKNKNLLIWSHNISPDGKLVLENKAGKLQYINLPNPNIGPAIIVNRITGASASARIKAALVPKGFEFFAENHCNVIFPPPKTSLTNIKKILKEIRSKDKLEIIQSITGNTQISKNELEKLFPINFRTLETLSGKKG